MKERIYQMTIGILSISLMFAFYKLYSKDDNIIHLSEQQENLQFKDAQDIKNTKKEYTFSIDTYKVKQKEINSFSSYKLSKKKDELDNSISKSLAMIDEYNQENPYSSIDTNLLQSSLEPQFNNIVNNTNDLTNFDEFSKKYESFDNKYNYQDSDNNENLSISSSYSNPSLVSTTKPTDTNNNTEIETIPTENKVVNIQNDLKLYTKEINEIKTLMSKIKENL
ncbi:hypothetical protein ACH5BK_08910 [Arcobacter sp. YIC-80]|uniref:hypothetical protein n=1 Tax=Arcobacter sp. YIC-80 TaxID=3376683 RepID=UPI00384EE316